MSFCTASTDYYGAIVNTQLQRFGRKQTKKAKEIREQAGNPNIIVS